MDANPLRIGILGAASIAPVALIRPAREVPGVVIHAVAARDENRAGAFARKHQIAKVHGSYEALLEDPELDAIYNPLPNGLHGVWTRRALEAGKHVLCEKPFTANADEAREVASVARQSGRVVMEAFHWRYHPLARRMLQIVRSGELGELRHVEATLCAPILNPKDIRYQLELAGGAGMDMGCYVVHIVRSLAGVEPTVRSARVKLLKPAVDRAMEIDLDFPGGATGRARCSMLSWRLLSISARVEGSLGSLAVFNPIAPQVYHRLKVRVGGSVRSERFPGPSTYAHQLQAFAAAVREGAPIFTGPEDAVANMSVIDAAYRAAGLEPRKPTPA